MDLSFTPEERAFRDEMRRFFRTEIPAEIRDRAGRGEHVSKQDLVTTQRAMNKAGIAVPHWPEQWGGKAGARCSPTSGWTRCRPPRSRLRWRSTPPWSAR